MLAFRRFALEQEFEQLDGRLQVLLYSLAGYVQYHFSKDVTITSLLRPGRGSVHNYARGADVAADSFSPAEGDAIVAFINSVFVYGRPGKFCLFDERKNVSDGWTAPHFHLQVNPSNQMLVES